MSPSGPVLNLPALAEMDRALEDPGRHGGAGRLEDACSRPKRKWPDARPTWLARSSTAGAAGDGRPAAITGMGPRSKWLPTSARCRRRAGRQPGCRAWDFCARSFCSWAAPPPSEDEQAEIYAGVARALGPDNPGHRTLDVGGDRPCPTCPSPKRIPLGERGLRVMHPPDLMQTSSSHPPARSGRLMVMLPMVTTVSEFRGPQGLRRGHAWTRPRSVGPDDRVPAAALMAEAFAREADFFSIWHQRSDPIHAGWIADTDGAPVDGLRGGAAPDRRHGRGLSWTMGSMAAESPGRQATAGGSGRR